MIAVTPEPLDSLRRRTSRKWTTYPSDVLPLHVAESDYALAPAIRQVLLERIEASDTGYAGMPNEVGAAFSGFARRHWGWEVPAEEVHIATDVSVAIVEVLRRVVRPADQVVLTPPVYPPFWEFIDEAGARAVEVPLTAEGDGWLLDLDGLERAFAAGARAMLLCNPHNPLGLVHARDQLTELADLAARYGVTVMSDEIHAPLTYPTATFVPFLSVSDAARAVGVVATSASKAFNLAGLKCALMVAQSPHLGAEIRAMPREVPWRASILGLHASIAAFEAADPWLDACVADIVRRERQLRQLLDVMLPGVAMLRHEAGYLAWLDFRALGWGDDPAERILERARVALTSGTGFGPQGAGFARLNFGCSSDVLTEAVERIAALG
jgi:cystathionine beta-lyase